MNELNMSSFIQIMQVGLRTHDKQEAAGVFLLSSINDQEYVGLNGYATTNLSSKKISRIVSRDDQVPDGIRQASMLQNVIDDTIEYFRNEVVPDMNPHLKDDVIGNLISLIKIDNSISDAKKKNLIYFFDSGDEARFLAEVFLYAVNKPNKKSQDAIEYDDAPLLDEVNYECPICHKKLVDTIKEKAIKKYTITQIFPETLDEDLKPDFEAYRAAPSDYLDMSNLIALDRDCSEEYLLNPTLDEYKNLCEIKDELRKITYAKKAVNNIQLEEDIRVIISALTKIHDVSELAPLEYDALRIEDKIKSNNFILKNETQNHVVTYYRYIEKVFSESDANFDMIASEIKLCSQKFEKAGLTQQQVVDALSEWIREKTPLQDNVKSKLACTIVVSFFIQNCEVFYK